MMLGVARPRVGPGQSLGQVSRGLLHLSCFGRPMINFQTAQMIVVKNWFWCKKKKRAIIHCDKYIHYPLFVTKDKPTHKENHVDDLKTMEEDLDTFSIQSTQSVFDKSPPGPAIFHERGQPLFVAAVSWQSAQRCYQLNCPLIWAILTPQGVVAVVRSGDKISVVLFGNQNPNLFYLRTNNATKWQINQTTVYTNVHFTVDAIMYMCVNNDVLVGSIVYGPFRVVWANK